MLLKSANASTREGTKEWERLKNTVNTYMPAGPMGSQDPTMRINTKDSEAKILGEDDTLRVRWGKKKSSRSGKTGRGHIKAV